MAEEPAAEPPNPDEKKTPEKIRYRGGRFSFFLSLEKPSSFSIPVSGSFSPLYLGNKENIVYIIIKTCIRRDDACRSPVLYIHVFGLIEIILPLSDDGGQTYRHGYRTDTGSVPTCGLSAELYPTDANSGGTPAGVGTDPVSVRYPYRCPHQFSLPTA